MKFDFSFADSKKSYTTIGSLLSDEKCTKQWNQYYFSGMDLRTKNWLWGDDYNPSKTLRNTRDIDRQRIIA